MCKLLLLFVVYCNLFARGLGGCRDYPPEKYAQFNDVKLQACLDVLIEADKADGNYIKDLANKMNMNVPNGGKFLFKEKLADVEAKPLYKAYLDLMYLASGKNTYEPVVGKGENLDKKNKEEEEKKADIATFLRTIRQTTVYAKLFTDPACKLNDDPLAKKLAKTMSNTQTPKDLFINTQGSGHIRDMWFQEFSRPRSTTESEMTNKKFDSCAFEHDFLGEIQDGKPYGLHDWFRVSISERREGEQQLIVTGVTSKQLLPIQMKFKWQGTSVKPKASMLVGPSPAFHIVAYSLIQWVKADATFNINIDGKPVTIVSVVECVNINGKKKQLVNNIYACPQGAC